MFIQTLQTDPRLFFAVVLTVVVSITLHELAHGFAALRVGDTTPEDSGHMTLNPLVHMGTFSLVALAVAGIAWGAMPIDPTRMRGRHAEAKVALAGPLTNALLGLASLTALGLWWRFDGRTVEQAGPTLDNLAFLLRVFGATNWALCVFNLLPVPPLDGSHVLSDFSRPFRELTRDPSKQWVFLVLFAAVFFFGGRFLGFVFDGANRYVDWLQAVGRA